MGWKIYTTHTTGKGLIDFIKNLYKLIDDPNSKWAKDLRHFIKEHIKIDNSYRKGAHPQ